MALRLASTLVKRSSCLPFQLRWIETLSFLPDLESANAGGSLSSVSIVHHVKMQMRFRRVPGVADFAKDVLPIFTSRCGACHSGSSPQAELDLSTPESALRGGKSGRVIVPGASGRSLLIEKVVSGSMPMPVSVT